MKDLELKINDVGSHNVIIGANSPIKAWTKGVQLEHHALAQLKNVANLPFIHKHVAVMPDAHAGIGCTVGSVIATAKAIVPAFVGVDLSCGVLAAKTTLTASDLPDSLAKLRSLIEATVPHGRTDNGGRNDRGAWGSAPDYIEAAWMGLEPGYKKIIAKNPKASINGSPLNQLGTLGGGNHMLEICLDLEQNVWIMLHSGSRGVGNRIGSYFIEQAKEDMRRFFINLPDENCAYIPDGSELFNDYVEALDWAGEYASENRAMMLHGIIRAMKNSKLLPKFSADIEVVSCHHNYVTKERHFGSDVWVTRKGALCARKNTMGIILGSMGAKSFIVRGKGNAESFNSCSHGAGRVMSRTEAKNTFTLKDHRIATEGVECRKDKEVIDETPRAYKNIEDVMAAQSDLVEIVHTLKQCLCVKG